ncbi:MAG: hypothetical protein R3344_02790 [Acidobacteriota bacterium]|nr:hypothetical protein [Acidobacteriota bacterium]
MRTDEIRRRSRWMIRAQEWDEPRARYPNVWHEGMPRHVLAYDTVASRMRLGDLVAVFYPASQKHPDRSERFLGISRVVGLRRSHDPACAWIDLETAHRFDPPLNLGEAPRRVFLCCDPGWSEHEVEAFRKVFDAAVAAGWEPTPEETEEGAPSRPATRHDESSRHDTEEAPDAGEAPASSPDAGTILFGGAAMNGDMRDPRTGTWLALVALRGEQLELVRLEATGRSGLHGHLRDPDADLMRASAIGLGFPVGLPLAFAESLLDGPFPDEGWWALAGKLEKMSRPDFLVALQEFRESHGPLTRYTDEVAGAPSPLHRAGPDIGSMAYHGIKLLAEERSRYAMRPFEQAQGKVLIEVFPEGAAKKLAGNGATTIDAVASATELPVKIPAGYRSACESNAEALGAVMAARCAAAAVLSGETDKTPEELSEAEADRIRREGWIYGRSC